MASAFHKKALVSLAIFAMALFLGLSRPSQAATKTAISATLDIIADDYYDVYINGTQLAQPACYTNGPFYCKATTVTYDVLGSLICGGNNVVATTVYDVPGGKMFVSYILT